MIEPVELFLANLRARDRIEIDESGMTLASVRFALESAEPVESSWFHHESKLVAFLMFTELTPCALGVTMLATDAWPQVARSVYRWGVSHVRPALLAKGYRRAECRTMEGHADAISMLEHFGFALECRVPEYGSSGRAFLQYAWRLSDHVPASGIEVPATATATAAADG